MLSYNERQKEIQRLREENKSILNTPLMSEGSISPYQIGLMSNNQRAKWQESAQKRMIIESEIRLLLRSDEQIKQDEQRELDKKIQGRLLQIDNMIQTLSHFTGKKGTILPKYQKEIQRLQSERNNLTGL